MNRDLSAKEAATELLKKHPETFATWKNDTTTWHLEI